MVLIHNSLIVFIGAQYKKLGCGYILKLHRCVFTKICPRYEITSNDPKKVFKIKTFYKQYNGVRIYNL